MAGTCALSSCAMKAATAALAMPWWMIAIQALGALCVLRFAFEIGKMLYQSYLQRGISLSKFGAGTGAWAVVTGASDGIGKEFALQLAAAKFNVVLMARTESKLQALAKEIDEKSGVDTLVIPFDFSSLNETAYAKLKTILEPLNITVLVNNVGTNHDFPVSFIEEDESVVSNIINVNITSVMKITKLIAPKLVKQKKGLILNLGSFAGVIPQPYLSVYSASKAFLSTWSAALAQELRPHKVHVQCLTTYFVVSAMSKIRRPSWTIPTAKAYVRAALRGIGVNRGSSMPNVAAPYPPHAFLLWIIEHVFTWSFWVSLVLKTQLSVRKRALKKLEREKAAKKVDS